MGPLLLVVRSRLALLPLFGQLFKNVFDVSVERAPFLDGFIAEGFPGRRG
jgi:hypothetical protein